MSEDDEEHDGKKDQPTRVGGTGKDLLGWLKRGRSTGSSEEGTTDERRESSEGAIDRRTYMLMAGGAATAAVGGTVASSTVSGSGMQLQQPDIYGYGGSNLEPSGQSVTLLSETADDNSVTQTGENAHRATAMAIDPGTLVNATLDTGTVDWFAFAADAGDSIAVDYEREHERGITGLILYEPDGSFKESLYVGTGSVHTMREPAAESGEHYLQIIDVKNGGGEYAFTVWLDEDPERDEDDGGDSEETVTLSQTLTVRSTGSEVDYAVETTEGIVAGSTGKEATDPDTTATGTVAADDEEWYWWDGDVTDVSLSTDAEFYVNGEQVDPSQWNDDDDGDDLEEDDSNDDHFGKLGYGEGPYGGTDAN